MRVGLRSARVGESGASRISLVVALAIAACIGLAPAAAQARPTGAAQKSSPLTIKNAALKEAVLKDAALKAKVAVDLAELGKPGDLVPFKAAYPAGAIVVVNGERRLYLVLGKGQAIRYPVAVGREDEVWTGKSFVQAKVRNPEWVPVDEPERRVPPGPDNPLGERALYLGWTLYRIHGTNSPGSIGSAASAGCVRMHNHHVKDLFERVHIGAPVFVIDSISSGRVDARPRKLASR